MKIEHLHKVYHNQNNDVHALQDLNFTVETCGITIILGSSGCGKTTLLNIISGKDHDYEGTVEIKGMIQYIEQDIQLFEQMSIKENLALVSDDQERIDEYLKKLQLYEERTKKVKKLSVGQKKRVQILRAFLSDCDYLLCDEPTAALDHDNSVLVMEELKEMSNHIPVIMVTHELSICETYADRICTMDQGRIVKDKTAFVTKKYGGSTVSSHNQTKHHTNLVWLKLKTRPGETIIHMLFCFLLVLSLYGSFTLFSSISSVSKEKQAWETSENLLIPQANEGNYEIHEEDRYFYQKDPNCEEGGQCAYYYDLYTKENIQTVMNEVDSVIGYRSGWNMSLYTANFYTPTIPYKQAQNIIQEYEQTGKEKTEKVQELERCILDYAKAPASVKEKAICFDFRNYDAFINQGSNFPEASSTDTFATGYSTPAMFYQVKDTYEFPLLYGDQIKEKQDVILSYNTAELLVRDLKLTSLEELIDREIPYTIPMLLDTGDSDSQDVIKQVRVAGITDFKHKEENMIFGPVGVYDDWIETAYEMKPDYIKYQFVYFLGNPSDDLDQIIAQINERLPGTYSTFVSYVDSNIMKSESTYENPIMFGVFALILVGACLMSLVLYEVICKARLSKEERLSDRLGYSSEAILIKQSILVCIPAVVLLGCIFPGAVTKLNELATNLHYAEVMSFSIIKYLLIASVSVLLYVGIRLIFYRRRNNNRIL